MTVYFWAAKYFTWLLSLYHGGHLCLIPSELFALAWLPFSLASAPWAANYLGLVFILEYEGHSFRTFQLSDLWSGFSSLGSKIVLYFQILLSPSLPLRVTSKKEWNGNLKFIVNLFRPLSYILAKLCSLLLLL